MIFSNDPELEAMVKQIEIERLLDHLDSLPPEERIWAVAVLNAEAEVANGVEGAQEALEGIIQERTLAHQAGLKAKEEAEALLWASIENEVQHITPEEE